MELQQTIENLQPAQAMQGLPVLPPSSKLVAAIQSKKIHQAGNEPLVQALRRCMLMIGLRPQNQPNQTDFDFLKSFIIQQFGQNTPDEIVLAFEMAITGKLPNLTTEDANCYENFSCAYVGKIMAAYRKWASSELNDINRQKMALQAPEKVSDEKADWTNEWAEILNQFEAGKRVPLIPAIYDWLKSEGKLPYTKQESAQFVKKALAELLTKERDALTIQGEKYSNWVLLEALQRANISDLGIVREKVKARAKVLALEDYVQMVLQYRKENGGAGIVNI